MLSCVTDCSTVLATTLALVVYYVYTLLCPPIDNGSHDDKTTKVLTEEPKPPAACAPIVNALNAAEVTEDEGACVDTMRNIVKAGHLKYSVLKTDPGALLRCSKYVVLVFSELAELV
jgi:hypothetical protein